LRAAPKVLKILGAGKKDFMESTFTSFKSGEGEKRCKSAQGLEKWRQRGEFHWGDEWDSSLLAAVKRGCNNRKGWANDSTKKGA